MTFCAQITPSLCFGLISVQGKLNLANGGGLNLRKYTPLVIHLGNDVFNFFCPSINEGKIIPTKKF